LRHSSQGRSEVPNPSDSSTDSEGGSTVGEQ